MRNNRIVWTPIAINSLREIKKFVLEQWSQDVLDYLLDLVDKRIHQLRSNPEMAPIVEKTQYRKLIIHKNISLFYVNENSLTKILLIWDNRQSPEKLYKVLTTADQ